MEPVSFPQFAHLPSEVPDEGLPHDDKYVVFKRSEFYQMLGYLLSEASMAGTDYETPSALPEIEKAIVLDAVVIRRQDYFAAPALATYASMIGMANILATDPDVKKRMIKVADYFQRQSEAAAEQGFKFPD